MLVCKNTGVFHIVEYNSCMYAMRKAIKLPAIGASCGTASADTSRMK
jgi:hypothetical protein